MVLPELANEKVVCFSALEALSFLFALFLKYVSAFSNVTYLPTTRQLFFNIWQHRFSDTPVSAYNEAAMASPFKHTLISAFSLACCLLAASPAQADPASQTPWARIALTEYENRVYAAWLGQIVGNIYGLSYEFQFIGTPGPDHFPYGYGPSLDRVRDINGAFSDDDTDIEYMYLLQMERHGPEPTYQQLADAWTHHVRDKVWVANRAALNLMRAGFGPPLTGHRSYNPQWFQIDPQLVNEIWAVTAPGMIEYAVDKSAWAARITNDDFGIEPTMHYAAMYAAAFFEKDLLRLIDIGTRALPPGSRFAQVIEHMKQLHRQYPDDWQAARREMALAYYYGDSGQTSGELGTGAFEYNRHAWPAVDALLNGACGILALLYGAGDFQRTLDMASGLGFDADNQAATMSGLLGILNGLEAIPHERLHPLSDAQWKAPFNDRYINVSRYDLPDASIRDLARRTAMQGVKVVTRHGGRVENIDGTDYLVIDRSAGFAPPRELARAPVLLTERDELFEFQPWFGARRLDGPAVSVGTLPPGLTFDGRAITGRPERTGRYEFTLEGSTEGTLVTGDYTILVLPRNIAADATEVLVNDNVSTDPVAVIRDGQRRGQTFYNRTLSTEPRRNFYGYRWEQPQSIGALWLNTGLPEEWGGWFTSLDVQYLDEEGRWNSVNDLNVTPPINLENAQWLKGSYIDHLLSFSPVKTRAIRLIGQAGGIEQDARNGGQRRHYSALSELQVHPFVPAHSP